MKERSTVSILIPIYKVERWIEKSARSAFEQTFENIDFIFVDDCSPDNSIEILKQVINDYPHRTPKVRIIHHERNRGIAVVRNALVEACNTEFLFFLDSDDWMEPNAIELLVNKQLETGADIVTGRIIEHTSQGEVPYKTLGYDKDRESTLLGLLTDQAVSPVLHCRLIKTALFKNNHITFEESVNLSEDFCVTPRLFYFSKIAAGIPNFIVHYNRQNTNSYTYNYETDWNLQSQVLKSYEITKAFFADKDMKYKEAIEMSIFDKYRYMLFLSTQNSNKEGFNYCKRYLKDNKHCYKKLRGGKMVRFFESSYFLMRATYRLRLIRAHLLSKFK
ncbi:MAG: glycosyltransferase family 2 protein [Prevotella sp.]|nr:glycosyltransferase family 2 protein [Prevotella sp.]